jgi:hypothetical protein
MEQSSSIDTMWPLYGAISTDATTNKKYTVPVQWNTTKKGKQTGLVLGDLDGCHSLQLMICIPNTSTGGEEQKVNDIKHPIWYLVSTKVN